MFYIIYINSSKEFIEVCEKMRLQSYITERESLYGPGITFMDLDDTILYTDAKINVFNKEGKVVRRLGNFAFLHYKPEEGETFDFSEYDDTEHFKKTSKPVTKVIQRIQRMFKNIQRRGSRVVIVTGRADLDNKEKFLQTMRDFGVPIDDIYVERVGNPGSASADLPTKKKNVIFKYLSAGQYRRARIIDDSKANCQAFLELEDELPDNIIKKVRERYNVPDGEPAIEFYALQVQRDGSLRRITKN